MKRLENSSYLGVVGNITLFKIVKLFMRLIFLITLLLSNFITYSQTLNNQSIELSTQIRREKIADYTTQYGAASYQNDLQLNGTSIGVDLAYKRILKDRWFMRPSVGFYKFAVDRITNHRIPAWTNDPTHYRPIDYRPDSTPIGYATSKYHYNNVSFGLALGKAFYLKENLSLTTDLAFTYLITFAQHYKVENGYMTTNKKSLGYLFDYRIGVQREFNNYFLTTNFVLPLYKEWRQDEVFLENPDNKIGKWFGGYGLALTVGKYLR